MLDNHPFPVVIDTDVSTAVYREIGYKQTGTYTLLYSGEYRDTLWAQDRWYYDKCDSLRWGFHSRFPYDDSASAMKLLVDTSRVISNHYYSFEDLNPGEHNALYKAYPVYLINTSKDTLSICFGWTIPIVTEALDSSGTWRAIEYRFFYDCGTGLEHVSLAPQHIALTSVAIDRGAFHTKLRLRYKDNIYSAEFEGSIDPKRFTQGKNMMNELEKEFGKP